MPYRCPLCALEPSSHSLKKVFETPDTIYYYTCPAEAILYYDVKGIVEHYEGVLSELPENKEWVWIFDSLGFGFKHAIQTNVAIELAKLISNKFSKTLKKIIIINPTFYTAIIQKAIIPFMNKKVRDLIVVDYESAHVDEVFQ